MSEGEMLWKIIAIVITLGNAATSWAIFTGRAQKRQIEPNPLEVREAHEFVRRADFHKHAELNRESHAALEASVRQIGLDVAAVMEAREENGRRLEVIESDLKGMNRTLGSLEESARRIESAAATAQQAALTAQAAFVEAQHKRTA